MPFRDDHLTDEQRLMRDTCRRYGDGVVVPFLREGRTREWDVDPAAGPEAVAADPPPAE